VSTPPPLVDAAERDLIASALDQTLVVEAAAGTGKTTALVRRILNVLATGPAQVTTIAAVTFTEKAAGELKLRIRQELEEMRGSEPDPARRIRLDAGLTHLEEAHIGTIHGFCADLLRERPVEAGVDPLFAVLTEAQSRRCFDEAFSAWLQETLEDPPPGVRRALKRTSRPMTGSDGDDGPVERLRRAAWDLTEWRDFPAPWARPEFDRTAAIDRLVSDVGAFAQRRSRVTSPRDVLYQDTEAAQRAADELGLAMASADYDTAEAALVDLKRDRGFRRIRSGRGAAYGTGVPRAEVQAAYQALLTALDAFATDADADLAALLRDELRGCIDRYETLKAGRGALDFLDLLLRARDLVRGRPDVRRVFQARFTHLFVDEFQDTDPLQAELLLLLAADDPAEDAWTRVRPVPGKLFIVGDPKQSIYRFRRADVGIYRTVCDQLVRHGARPVHLTTSFRGVPNIQRAVNAAFAPLMTGDPTTLQSHYVPLLPRRPNPPDQPSVVALPVPKPYGIRNVSGAAIDGSLPAAVGAFVDWLVHDSGWTVTERRTDEAPGSVEPRVPIEPRHVCILFRRFVSYGTDVTRGYVDALEARGVRHLLVGGRAFHDREEVETLRAALAAIEWPDDELSVFATLRGALFAAGDEELLEYRHRPDVRGFHPFRRPEGLPDHLAPIGEALALLAELHLKRNRRPVAETISRLLGATRAHVGFALRRAGEQVLANVLHVAELARQYEAGGGISFRGFVEELRSAAEDGVATEAPIVEEGSDGVRLMTVHKAKGLEFPVVILADMTAKLAAAEAARYLDADAGLCALRIGGWSPRALVLQQALEQAREREEGIRIAYVAATRARDVLVVPAVGDGPYSGWVGPLDAAIFPPAGRRRDQTSAPRCPAFRKDSVLNRPSDEPAGAQTVCPGLHTLGEETAAAFDVVWWDPATLRLDVEPPFGLRRQELIAKEASPEVVADGQRAYRDWREGREAAVRAGCAPALEVRTATEWARAAGSALSRAPVEVVALEAASGRPSGARFGTLVHASLATVSLAADAGAIAQVVRMQGRIVAAPEAEVAAAIDVVRAALAHPLLDDARARPARCLRETPVTASVDGVLVEGIVDLAFETESGMTVVDFKTDRAEGERFEQYRRQLGLYADAITIATGRPVRAVLLEL
jgi:ATP-dependent exoDNAse (exonuclease V) beta subunit